MGERDADHVPLALLALIGLGLSVRENHRLRQRARRDARSMQAVADSLSQGVYATDATGRVTFVNAAAERLLGRSRAELLGHAPQEQFASASGMYRRCDGTEFRVDAARTPLAGTTGAAVFAFSDATDRIELTAAEARLQESETRDPLTGLPNRAQFMDCLSQAFARRKNGYPLTLLTLDVDKFKDVNDSLGHAAGDDLLRAVARRLVGCVRPEDTVARLGGDEFGVIPSATAGDDEDGVPGIARRIMTAFEQPLATDTAILNVSISMGAAVRDGESDPDELLQHADLALYAAKATGGCCVRFAPELYALEQERAMLRSELRGATRRGEMRVHYQPIFELGDRRIIGVEALVRWQHPQRGLLAPGDFIALAEESSEIIDIGRWVLERACADCARWNAERPHQPGLSAFVNLSARQLEFEGIADHVDRAVAASGFDPHRLVLEVTEGILMRDLSATAATLGQLQLRGARIALDDFGTGYSSLAYLRQLPVNLIKIDRSLVSGGSRRETAVLQAIVDLAQGLAMEVLAEGIETAEQLELLTSLGCEFAQGFHLARPAVPADVERLLVAGVEPAGAEPGRPAPPVGGGEVILVVEDHIGTLELIGHELRRSGYAPRLAVTAGEGIRIARDEQPRAVVIDLNLPGMDGLQAARELRADPRTAAIPLLACSGVSVTSFASGEGDSPFDAEIAKPTSERGAFGKAITRFLATTAGAHHE